MALLTCRFFSDVLELSSAMTVILPQRSDAQIGMPGVRRDGPVPVLYLLHGLSDDDSIWTRRTSVERYAAQLGIAVVMPQVHRSFYADQAQGLRFWTFLTGELPALVQSMFRVSDRREDTFVCGLSMGGYGAMKWALRHPERFAAAASLSGTLDLGALTRTARHEVARELRLAFGDGPVPGEDDVLALLDRADPGSLPRLYAACGTEDGLLGSTEAFLATAARRGIPVTTHLGPGGHDWQYWDDRIRDVLAWLPLDG